MSDLERKARMQLNADKTKIMCFHETTQVRNTRKNPRRILGKSVWPALFHILSMFPDYTNPNTRLHTYPGFLSTPLQEVTQIDYLGLRLDPMLTMKPAVAPIQEKASKGHSLALAVMMMIAFITVRSSLVPLIEGLCAQIYFRFEISVVCVHLFCFSFSEEKIC